MNDEWDDGCCEEPGILPEVECAAWGHVAPEQLVVVPGYLSDSYQSPSGYHVTYEPVILTLTGHTGTTATARVQSVEDAFAEVPAKREPARVSAICSRCHVTLYERKILLPADLRPRACSRKWKYVLHREQGRPVAYAGWWVPPPDVVEHWQRLYERAQRRMRLDTVEQYFRDE